MFGSADRIAGLGSVRGKTRLEHCVSFGGVAPAGAIDFARLLSEPPDRLGSYPVQGIALDDACTVGYTSGTTGHPKGAVLTHRSIVMNTAMTATMHMRTEHDVVASALPCSHVYGNVVMNGAIAYGGTLVLHRRLMPRACCGASRATAARCSKVCRRCTCTFSTMRDWATTTCRR